MHGENVGTVYSFYYSAFYWFRLNIYSVDVNLLTNNVKSFDNIYRLITNFYSQIATWISLV